MFYTYSDTLDVFIGIVINITKNNNKLTTSQVTTLISNMYTW